MTDYLTTRELAALLRIKERKVYDLAASGKVPCSRATGKLLFPRAEIEAWIEAERTDGLAGGLARGLAGRMPQRPAAVLPNVVLGSHDPLLEWALRESRSGLATYFDGSCDGLTRLEAGEGIAAGLHLYDAEVEDWNTPKMLGACAELPVVLVEWARRRRGLILAPGLKGQVAGIVDVVGRRFAARQEEAGAQLLFEQLSLKADLDRDAIECAVLARSESEAALAVLDGRAEVAFGLQALAEQYRLGFVPVIEERFDLLVDRRSWFEAPIQRLVQFCRTDMFAERAQVFPGYDVSGFATVHCNGR